MTKATAKHVRQWMLSLMARQAPQSEADVKAAVALSLLAMQLRFPAETYCQASLDAVAATERFWNEAGVSRALEAWRSTNAPQDVAALPPEAESAMVSREAKLWLAMWYRADSDTAAERTLDLIRARSDEAFAYLMRVDVRAADIAVWRKWAPHSRDSLAMDWQDEAVIRSYARRIAAIERGPSRMQASLWQIVFNTFVQIVKVNAPQHQDAMLDELRWIASGGAAGEAEPIPVAFQAPPAVMFDDEMFR